MQKLAATAVKQARATESTYKLTDGGGLYLLVKQQGKYWRYDYRFAGKRKTLALGVYPDVTLAEARKRHSEAREQLSNDIDPSEIKKVKKITQHLAIGDSFESIAREWFCQHMVMLSEGHQKRTMRLLEKDLFPALGMRPISKITPPEMLGALRKIEERTIDIARRAKQTAGLVFRYAIATGRCNQDPSRDLGEALKSKKQKHLAAITEPSRVGSLMVAIDNYDGTPAVKAALKLSALLFQRPGEIRHMEWKEINWQEDLWEIPAEKMKMKRDHIVPLSSQAKDILSGLQAHTIRSIYVFPSIRSASKPLSDNGVRSALRIMGYDNNAMSAHGFRAMARTMLDEVLNFRVDWIEHQLAHAVKDSNGRAYNRTSHLEGRRHMMQAWADYLEYLMRVSRGDCEVKYRIRPKISAGQSDPY